MATSGEGELTLDEFRLLSERAGLGLRSDELAELKPLYELYLKLIAPMRSLNLKAEEIGVAFHPDWPSL